MTPTRLKILEYLHQHPSVTAPELSRALGMTRANIRYHLALLLEASEIESVTDRLPPQPARGRPIQHFRLSTRARPNNLLQLSSLLLDDFLQSHAGPAQQDEALRALAYRLVATETLPRQVTQRLTRAVQILNTKRYQARWEARAARPLIIFRSCPYAALLPEHPELCRMDVYLLERLTGQPIEQTARIDPFGGNPPACLFLAGQPASADQPAIPG